MKQPRRKEILAGITAMAGLLGLALFSVGGPIPVSIPKAQEIAISEKAPCSEEWEGSLPINDEEIILGMTFVPVTITAYSSTIDQTDKTPWLTASLTRTRPGVLALSRDLIKTYAPDAPFDYGDLVLVSGVGLFRVEDTMNARWENRADIWFPTKYQARRWGNRKGLLAKIKGQSTSPLLVANEAHLATILYSQ
ncbi:MAG: 3D domain-containing protein [Candidatus Eisenbacteria bacterium]|uniref:3D domain-containing protein n=1 Tax=Eiseniibacteriota bacterium TaxID=2212470 RepID=A0A948W4S1_UNCEI|nr:3D domain-containing protein [Candidatus Eisenbacteria bacterium]MBU2692527.1 3D domain-containing protein [Candidatus Eisenbacteria bacterium]